jgi:hypothetical protein
MIEVNSCDFHGNLEVTFDSPSLLKNPLASQSSGSENAVETRGLLLVPTSSNQAGQDRG